MFLIVFHLPLCFSISLYQYFSHKAKWNFGKIAVPFPFYHLTSSGPSHSGGTRWCQLSQWGLKALGGRNGCLDWASLILCLHLASVSLHALSSHTIKTQSHLTEIKHRYSEENMFYPKLPQCFFKQIIYFQSKYTAVLYEPYIWV